MKASNTHLGVRPGVGDDEQAGLAELLRDLVGEGTGGEAAGDGQAARVLGELEHRALAVRAGGDGHHVLQESGKRLNRRERRRKRERPTNEGVGSEDRRRRREESSDGRVRRGNQTPKVLPGRTTNPSLLAMPV